MFAILRRELAAYFASPIGYIYLAVFYALSGFFFSLYTLAQNSTDLAPVFSYQFSIILFVIPVLTMRLLSEDNKNRTDQALLTAPISLTGLVLGKFLAAWLVFALGLAITGVYTIVIAAFAVPNYAIIFGNFLALLLLGGALIAIGMMISAMTENQVIAAVGGFAVGLFLLSIDILSAVVSNPVINAIVDGLSFSKRYAQFAYGLFNLSSIVFFLSVSAVFIFLTVRVLEKRRWS